MFPPLVFYVKISGFCRRGRLEDRPNHCDQRIKVLVKLRQARRVAPKLGKNGQNQAFAELSAQAGGTEGAITTFVRLLKLATVSVVNLVA